MSIRHVQILCSDANIASQVVVLANSQQEELMARTRGRAIDLYHDAKFAEDTATLYGRVRNRGCTVYAKLYFKQWRLLRWRMPILHNDKGGWRIVENLDECNDALERAFREELRILEGRQVTVTNQINTAGSKKSSRTETIDSGSVFMGDKEL